MASALAAALPGRRIHVVGDAAYAGKELKKLAPGITWTTRLRKDAALHDLPPARTGRRGRPRARGDRLPSLAKLAAGQAFTQVTVTRYGTTVTLQAAALTCLWYSVFGSRPVQAVLGMPTQMPHRDYNELQLPYLLTPTATQRETATVILSASWPANLANRDE